MIALPFAGPSIFITLFGPLAPVSVTGRERLGTSVSSELGLSVITIHGGSPLPVYPSTSALLT